MNEYLYSKNDQVTLYKGNNVDVLKTLPAESINCVVTSPPYYNLRDYGSATWIGGDENCDHKSIHAKRGMNPTNDYVKQSTSNEGMGVDFYTTCPMCNAMKQDEQLGLEATPKEYVENMVQVFKEVKRVLAKNGTLWLNLGDSYSTFDNNGYKPKDLMGMPWRVAFALQDDGWYLRQDIIWHKPAPMPESVRDRCTKSHEYIFLLSKSAKYYYDADAIKEPTVSAKGFTERMNGNKQSIEQKHYAVIEPEFRKEIIEYRDLPEHNVIKEYLSEWRNKANLTIQEIEDHFNSQAPHHWFETNGSYPSAVDWEELKLLLGFDDFWDKRMTTIYEKSGMKQTGEYRNKRSVWSINTASYKDSHFAVFPKELPMNCIKAGTREGDVVLDLFAGSGTTLQVAQELGRKAIGIDVKAEFLDMCLERTKQMGLF